jgi:hypothetical protein
MDNSRGGKVPGVDARARGRKRQIAGITDSAKKPVPGLAAAD